MIGKLTAAVAAVLLLGGCGGAHRATSTATTAAVPPKPAAAEPLPQPSKRCGSPSEPATTLRIPAAGGASLDGAIAGHGPVGVVLLHEYPGPMCGWWPYASYLGHHGIQALFFDFRCLGLSTCPKDGMGNPVADTAGAMAALRARGARSIAIVGASLGGVVSVMAGAKLHPSAVVDLSGERALGPLLPGVQLDSYAPAAHLTAPSLFAVAHGDQYTSVEDMRAVYRRAGSKTKRLIVLPNGGGHGWDMLADGLHWSPLAKTVLKFIKAHAR
jgi:alpha-beta hydrolase superfamily lysophospholipase